LQKYDLVVVGAGTGGAVAAKTAAKRGLKVCLVDRKKRGEIGDKVCGDAIGKHHFDNLGMAYPSGEEMDREIKGIEVFSPNRKAVFTVRGEGLHGFMINRLKFGQRVLNEALDAGVDLCDSWNASDLLISNGKVRGIIAKNPQLGKEDIPAGIVIDASGYAGVLRSKIPGAWLVEKTVKDADVIVCYREIRRVKGALEDSEYCKIYLDQETAPGGYSWIFPKDEDTVNVGLGVRMTGDFPNPRKQLYDRILSEPFFKDSRTIQGGGGVVPTRRPIDCMVGEGFMLVGDSACQVNPIHGGGIGPSMIAGKIAAEVVDRCLEKGDVSSKALWDYNLKYMKAYGAKQAGLDLFRLFIQKIGNDSIDYGMENVLIREEDLLKVSTGEELKLNITDKAERVLRGIGKISLIIRLREVAKLMKEMKNLYADYPSQEGFVDWRSKIEGLYGKIRED
jgi:digeranylgeranylglycerophospholipid reductase